jgi:hypothetical protein
MSKRYGVRSDLTYQGAVRYEKDEKIAAAAARAKQVRCGTREVLRQWRLEVDPGWSPSIHPTVRWNSNGRWGDRRPDAFLQHPRVQELGECTGLGISQTLWRIPVQRDTEEVLVDWLDMTREVDSAHAFLAPVLRLQNGGHREEARLALQRLSAIDEDGVRKALATLQLVQRDR